MNVAVFVRPATPPIFIALFVSTSDLLTFIVPDTTTIEPDAKFAPSPMSPTIPPIFAMNASVVAGLVVGTSTSIVPTNVFSPLNVVVTCLVVYASV